MSCHAALPARVLELAGDILNAGPAELRSSRLAGDASSRAYHRVRSDSSSVVVALYESPFDPTENAVSRLARLEAGSPSARLTFANDPCAHIEVTDLFLGAGVPVPRILAIAGDCGALLIEDLGDLRLEDCLDRLTGSEIERSYIEAISHIVRIQEGTESARAGDSISARLAFDEMKLRWELGFFYTHYFVRHLGLRIEPATNRQVQEEFRGLCVELANRPRVLTHRDFHARNLMVHQNALRVIDHQDARMGPISYDLVSLIWDPYATVARESAELLIDRFLDLKSRSGDPVTDRPAFEKEIHMMVVQRMLKAVGTYSYQAAIARNPSYEHYIKPALSAALQSMMEMNSFPALRDLILRTVES